MKTIGLTVMKALPPTIGHGLMIDFGATMLDEMHVIVGGKEDDEIPLSLRASWLADHYHDTNVTIHTFIDDILIGEKDEDGTVIDDKFWYEWLKVFTDICPNATHFVSSDMYGKVAAEKLGIKWLLVDPKRETIPISATMVRSNPKSYFNSILDKARPYFTKTIAIVGPESTGKSTIVKELAQMFSTVGVHEYGRTLTEQINGRELNVQDFLDITKGQSTLIRCGLKTANKILFTDTEAYTTYLYGQIYLQEDIQEIKDVAIKQNFDMYVLLSPVIPWDDDGTRVVPDLEDRIRFFNNMKVFLDEYKKPYIVVGTANAEQRLKMISSIVDDL